ncbi:MAG: MFS transporter [Verrucomicrobia bacterium]|nr:MFS transporter [Verrucomicrobiota bacterium]
MEAWRLFRSLNRDQRNTFIACFLGWSLDAFDYFLLTFVIPPLAHDFQRSIAEITYAITLTLAMRPVGAFLFGLFGDRFGRRIPLMIDVIFYSAMELLTAFSASYTWLLIFRALYGIGLGGEWGLGASLAMEALPVNARGLFSGILQQGYAFGYLLAAIVYWIVFPFLGWRGLFIVGALPAVLVLYIRAKVPESPSWRREKKNAPAFWRNLGTIGREHWLLFLYVIVLMTAFNAMSHGTQDLYQTFLGQQRRFGVSAKAAIGIIYSFGAICGGTVIGHFSQKYGRRRAIVGCALVGLLLIPLWVFSPGVLLLVLGGFLMQFMVQGAWGVVPVHLNELSPVGVRGTFPGFAYQLGNLLAANTALIEARLAMHFGSAAHPNYAMGMALFAAAVFVALAVIAVLGPEKRGRSF